MSVTIPPPTQADLHQFILQGFLYALREGKEQQSFVCLLYVASAIV